MIEKGKTRENLVEELKLIFECSPSAITISTLDGIYLEVNQGFERITGFSLAETLGKSAADLGLWRFLPRRQQVINGLMTNGYVNNFENQLTTKYGEIRTVLASLKIIKLNEVKHVLAVFDDITERIEAERKNAELAALVENSSDAVIIVCSGLIKYWNKSAEQLFGYLADEIIGEPYEIIVPDDKKGEYLRNQDCVQNGNKVNNYETVKLRKDGSRVEVSISGFPILPNGEVKGHALIIRDIGERKRIEKEMARLNQLNLVGQMAAGLGHEVRNPMTTVRGLLQMMGEQDFGSRAKEYFSLMISELDRANSIITEFLNLARNKSVEAEPLKINKVLAQIHPLLCTYAVKQDQQILVNLAEVPEIIADGKEIRQLVINLVKNGLESMPAGKRLIINTYMEGETVVLSVQDEGAGINKVVLDQIGTPFVTTKESRTGLGLPVCYSIAKRNQADIDIETGNSGTTFYVRFRVSQKPKQP